MLREITNQKVLIIDKEVDFCLLMKFYFEKRNNIVYYSVSLEDGCQLIEEIKPEVIIAEVNITEDLGAILKEKINSIKDYHPYIFTISGDRPK